MPWLRAVRHTAAPLMGLLAPGQEPGDAVPKVGLVGPPVPYTTTLGEPVAAEDYDVSVRMLTMNAPHPAIGLTSAVAVAAAGLLKDSVVSRAAGGPTGEWLRLGTPMRRRGRPLLGPARRRPGPRHRAAGCPAARRRTYLRTGIRSPRSCLNRDESPRTVPQPSPRGSPAPPGRALPSPPRTKEQRCLLK